ncbi:cell division protein FtsN [bacterium MnTg02]|nr:cell division protein FtsN [bacterium MnTg02]
MTKTKSRWVRVELGTKALSREVKALRCGLDVSGSSGKLCRELTGQNYTKTDRRNDKPLPFDLNRSHKLYQALFAPIEDLIKGKELILVPSGPLTQLPFQVLVTQKPTAQTTYSDAAWLVKSHALSIMPSVSSIMTLRQFAKTSRASRPYLGIGNPLLEGPDSRYADLAKEARQKQICKGLQPQRVASLGLTRTVKLPRLREANVDHIRKQSPLPETADEVCAVAKSLNATDLDIRLGKTATEDEIKTLSGTGALAKYQILHFATHGAMAGEVLGSGEPGLLLTPPKKGSEQDDGYLSASEITTLKLNAEWVILSACNTAAGGAAGAEALSGLARAFFYAGARALLVSHWAVASDPTVQLITGAFEALKQSPDIGRSEALRRSMIAMIEGKDKQLAHPEYWSPFILVGEGAASKPILSEAARVWVEVKVLELVIEQYSGTAQAQLARERLERLKAAQVAALPKPTKPAKPSSEVKPAISNRFVVQIAALRTQADALTAFFDIQQRYPNLLRSYQPLIQKAKLGSKRAWYRLRIGPFHNRSAASEMCSKLKAAGLRDCFVRPL